MKRILTLAFVLLFVLSCGPAKQNSIKVATSNVQQIVNVDPTVYGSTITATDLKTMLYTYASDEFEGRETGEPGQKKAVNYLRQQYMDMGIPSPLSDGDYFQEVPLEKQKSPEISITLNGKKYTNFKDFVLTGGTSTVTITADHIVYAGYGIEADNYSDYKDLDVKGKVVLIKAGEPKNEDGTYVTSGNTEPTKWNNGRQGRRSKRDVAKEKGAKALIMMDDDASFTRLSSYYSRIIKSGNSGHISLRKAEPKMLQFTVTENFGKALYEDINEDDSPKVLHTSLNINVKGSSENVSSENVLAFIKGSEKPNEILVISAHLDHLGVHNGKIYNGADDDGSGTIAVIEIAKAFEDAVKDGYRPRRSILFLNVTGEEKGLLGSEYYTTHPVFPLKNTIADLNIDMVGRIDPKHENNRNYVYLIGSNRLSTELHKISEDANQKYTHLDLDYTYNDDNDPNRFYYRSDHYNFAKHNIPVIFYFNGTHADYHQPTDTADKIEYNIYETRTRLVFYTAWELANRDQRIVVDKVETK
ncbi:MAG TPA: M28 family peptidase [Flavobacteriaceae bacterium]|nr:M28 family peptidase [Flavobacteriaceae bacterium]